MTDSQPDGELLLAPDLACRREQRRQEAERAILEIRRCELAQARPLRELVLDPGDAGARSRLAGLQARIERARAAIAAQNDP